MKKIFSMAFAGLALMLSTAACSDADYDDKYADPSKTTTVGVPQVFTGIMEAGNTWMNPVYYRYYTQSSTSGVFSGVIGESNGRGRFRGASEGYFNTRWMNFYNMLAQFRLLEHNYNNIPTQEEKDKNILFYYLGRTLVEAQLHEVLSLWGDVPFTGAGYLWRDFDYDAAKQACAYDDDVELYKQILKDLKQTADYLAGAVDGSTLGTLARQDFSLAAGNKEAWRKYVNSLRLRIALHLSTNGDCAAEGKAAIAEILGDPTQYPVIEENAENMGVAGDTQTDTFNYGKSLSQALHTGGMAMGSETMLTAMNVPTNGIPDANTDPRLQVMYDCNPDGEYVAYDVRMTNTEISNLSEEKNVEYVKKGIIGASYFCKIDSQAVAGNKSYEGNFNIGGLWMSAAEVALIKAEAYLMGYGVAADEAKAKENFINGIVLSNEYYWGLKKNSTLYKAGNDSYAGFRALVEPTEVEVLAYAESVWAPTQEAVATQLWINHSFMNELEAWNVVRRTGYPTVHFSRDTQVDNYPTPPHRLPYTSNELSYNSEHCQAAISKNYTESTGYYTKLFWAKDNYYTMVD